MDVINSLLTSIESFWGFLDTWTILRLYPISQISPLLGDISFLDFTFASYVISLSLWFVFGFNGGDE